VLFHVFSMPMNGFFCKSPYFSPFSEAVPIIGRRDKLGILPWFAEYLPPKQ